MCMSQPKIPPPAPPPPAPPPPTKMAQKVGNTSLKKRQGPSKKRGTGALRIRRSAVNTGSMGAGTGTNISY